MASTEEDYIIRDENGEEYKFSGVLPLIPIRELVVFPYMIVPLYINRTISMMAVDEALSGNNLLLLTTQKLMRVERPKPRDLYLTGAIGSIIRINKVSSGGFKLLLRGLVRAQVEEFIQEFPHYRVKVNPLRELPLSQISSETLSLLQEVKDNLLKMAHRAKTVSSEVLAITESIEDPGRLADLVASNIGLPLEDTQEVLEILDPVKRLRHVNEELFNELQVQELQAKISGNVKNDIKQHAGEICRIHQLSGGKDNRAKFPDEKADELQELRDKLDQACLPDYAEEEADKLLKRLGYMQLESAEASTIRTYLEWLSELPWSISTDDTIDLDRAQRVLDQDHYDLNIVKERILEYLSVRKLKADKRGPIICFAGPPGVGKTSLGRSIARAMERKFIRISLGGIRDEAEIRGHRRTYVGAMPGRIIQGIKMAVSNNPVFMLDEVDKLGADFRGDPSSALLEVLDPEQNFSFRDNYLNLPFDLTKVMFIATANLTDLIPAALRDRMEVIQLSGYTEEEKVKIAHQYLIPKQRPENGLNEEMIRFSDSAIAKIVALYTREAGLRELERKIAAICRKVARKVAQGKKKISNVTTQSLIRYLGPPRYLPEEEMQEDMVGTANGLAWTQSGGEILQVEATAMKGKGQLLITGQVGDVMRESAQAAMSFTRTRLESNNEMDADFFSKYDIHIHIPAGATPKDGPSAGVSMVVALISLVTRIPVRKDVAMTGEITLRGRILPIGGLKEKILAAVRAKLNKVIIPHANSKDLIDIPLRLRKKIEIFPVSKVEVAIQHALVNMEI